MPKSTGGKKKPCKNCEGKGTLKKEDKIVKCQRCGGSAPCSRSDISGWRDGVLYPLARGRRRRRRRLGRGASRPARAAWLVQRLLAADGDVAGGADSIFAIFGFRPTREHGNSGDRSDRGGAGELPGHRQAAASKAQRHRETPFTLIAVLTRAREGERRQ